MSANYTVGGSAMPFVEIHTHHEPDGWWAECPNCDGWTAAADTYDDLIRLTREWHEMVGTHSWHAMFIPEPSR